MMEFEKRCWAEISLENLRHNFELVRACAGNAGIMAVVKADGYGHGDVEAARLFEQAGASAFAVSGFEEALRIVNAGISPPVLVLGYTDPARARQLHENGVSQTVFSYEYAKELSDNAVLAKVNIKVHFKIDTGMNRLGFGACVSFDAAVNEIKAAMALPNLTFEGLFTHFAVADSSEGEDIEYTRLQHELFWRAHEALPQLSVLHCCNSAATVSQPSYSHTLVRPGIVLYGENPSAKVQLLGLRPALTLKAVISQVKRLPQGQCISYGRRFTSGDTMRVATLAVGYADGYPRNLSNKGTVSIHGKACRVLGTVCMDQMMVDVSEVDNVKIGDEAIIFGGGAADTAQQAAQLSGMIIYELLCGIGKRVPRVYLKNETTVAVVDYLR